MSVVASLCQHEQPYKELIHVHLLHIYSSLESHKTDTKSYPPNTHFYIALAAILAFAGLSLHDQRILKYEYVKPQNFKYGKPLIKKELAGGNGYNCLKACLLRNRPVVRVFVLSVEYSY